MAFIDILAELGKKYNEGYRLKAPKLYQETKDMVISSSDEYQDFMERFIIKTNNEKDKIHKDELTELVRQHIKNKEKISTRTVLDKFKNKGLIYNRQVRKDGFDVRGCFICCKFTFEEEDETETVKKDAFETREDEKNKNEKIKSLEEENKSLTEELNALKMELEKQTKKKFAKKNKKQLMKDAFELNEIIL